MNIWQYIKSLFYKPTKRPDNTGIIIDQRDTDYVVGSTSPIAYQERLRSGDWTPYAFDQEPQSSNRGDSLSCVTFSALNSIQAQEFFITGKKVNYSKRWIAKMSNTTREGNYLYKVADAIREYGLVLEEDYPPPDSFTWDEYHANIPEPKLSELKTKGKEWLKKWRVSYEFLQVSDPNLDYHLKHSPIQVVIPGHAVCGIYSPDQLMTYLDSYNPWIKKYASSSLLQAMKLILTPTTIEAKLFGWQGSPELWVAFPLDSMQRLAYVDQKLPEWLPDYYLNTSKIITLPVKRPS